MTVGGTNNKNEGRMSSIFGGTSNTIEGEGNFATIFGGDNNVADNISAVVGGGNRNHSSGYYSTVLGGHYNLANGGLSTAIGGENNNASGNGSVVVGGGHNLTSGIDSYASGGLYNNVTGRGASSLGGEYSSVNGILSTGVAGGSTGDDAVLALAAGNQSVVTNSGVEKTYISAEEYDQIASDVKSGEYIMDQSYSGAAPEDIRYIHYDKASTALGYQATANQPGTIAFGHDAGDESGYTYEWETLTDEKGNPKQNEIDGTTNDYTKAPKIKKKAPYTSAYYNRLVKVADGQDDHDVVVMEQLKQYAEKDAGNIGTNLTADTVYRKNDDGSIKVDSNGNPLVDEDATKKALTEAQTANENAWSTAIGTGKIADPNAADKKTNGSQQLVTGGTVYTEVRPKDGTYVHTASTTAANLSALDKQVAANTDALTKPNHNIKYYSVKVGPSLGFDQYTNENNNGAQGTASLAAGNVTHTDGVASTVVGSYSAVFGTGLQGAAAVSYGTVNVNNNTDTTKAYSGVANSIVGQANMTTNSNAAIIYGAGNTVTDSYRDIDKDKAEAISNSTGNAEQLKNALQDAVPTSGAQVMVMGGANSVDKAYMTQVTGVGNKVTGQDSTYAEETSTQYNYVDGFQNELTNGKHDYIIGSNNKVSGDSVDNNQSNIVIGDNHKLTNQKNNVIIGSSDKEQEMTASNAVSIGHNAKTGGDAVAIGEKAKALNQGIAVGANASAGYGQNMALGYYASVASGVNNSTALGYGSQITKRDILPTDGNDGVVSVGKAVGQSGEKGITRRIINVKAGVKDTDAVNVSQLKSAQTDLTDKGLTFAANSGTAYKAKLGDTVTIQGTEKKDGHEYTADNLTTEIDENGNIKILMDKDMSVEKIAVNGKDGENGAPGTPGSIGISGQDGQSSVGIDGKDGISIKGRDGKDGVTMKAVDGENGTEGHIGLTGPAGTNGINGANGQPGTSIDITVKNGYDGTDGKDGVKGEKGVDGTSLTRIVYKDGAGEHQVATMEDGLKFKGDDTTVINKKLNNTLDIIGGAKGDLTEGNIGVKSDSGKLKVQLAKDLTGITSISNQKTEGGKTTGAKITLGDDDSVDVNGGKITHVGSGADASGNYTTTTNAANIGDVQKIVKDAVDSAADTTNKALAGKANVDASNIGANLKGEDGKTPATEAEKTKNENAWGSAIGTGKIEANNGQLVTGKTVYEYNKPVAEDGKTLNYVSEGKTTGQNLGALDAQVKNNADAIKKNSESIQNITNNVKNLSDNAVQYDEDSNKTTVTLGGDGGTTITNVKGGTLSDSSTDAVNGKQLYDEQQAREKADAEINQKVTNNTNDITNIKNGNFTDASKTAIHNIAKNAVKVVDGKNTTVTTVDGTDTTPTTYAVNVEGTGKVAADNTGLISGDTLYKEVHVDKDGSYIKGSQTVGQNLSALDSGLKTTSDLIHTNTTGDTIQIGGNSTATKIDVNGKDGKGRVITGVVSDANDPNSAANVGYVNGLTAANTQQIYRDMNNAYSRLDTNINRAAAGSNALAALHPLDFDPADKASFAVGYGHYRNANAAAVGAFYQPNANTMVNMGISLGNGDPGFNAGVSLKIGKGSAYNGVSKAEMAQTIHDQATEISAIKADDAAKDKRIDALEKENQEMKKQIQEILARLNG